MNKPITIKAKELSDNLIKVINESELPIYILKIELEKIYNELSRMENEEIANYEKTQNNGIIEVENNTQEKESDK